MERCVKSVIQVGDGVPKVVLYVLSEGGKEKVLASSASEVFGVELWVDGVKKWVHLNDWLIGDPKITLYRPQDPAQT